MNSSSDVAQLLGVLEFRRETVLLLPIVSTLLAALAMAGVGVILATQERSRLRAFLLSSFVLSTLIFIFCTLVAVAITPAIKVADHARSAQHIAGLSALARVCVWTIVLGLVPLYSAVGLIGFLYSRRVGLFVLIAAVVVALAFFAWSVQLDHVMKI